MKNYLHIILGIICLVLVGCFALPKYNSPNEAAKDFAEKQNWFDYSYEIVENFDENNKVRYHVTYYWSKTDGTNGTVEYIFTYTSDDYKYEEIN